MQITFKNKSKKKQILNFKRNFIDKRQLKCYIISTLTCEKKDIKKKEVKNTKENFHIFYNLQILFLFFLLSIFRLSSSLSNFAACFLLLIFSVNWLNLLLFFSFLQVPNRPIREMNLFLYYQLTCMKGLWQTLACLPSCLEKEHAIACWLESRGRGMVGCRAWQCDSRGERLLQQTRKAGFTREAAEKWANHVRQQERKREEAGLEWTAGEWAGDAAHLREGGQEQGLGLGPRGKGKHQPGTNLAQAKERKQQATRERKKEKASRRREALLAWACHVAKRRNRPSGRRGGNRGEGQQASRLGPQLACHCWAYGLGY